MLAGRSTERARVAAVVAGAREGRAGALVVTGEPGIGKTALIDDAVRDASDATILRCRGVEDESAIPFSALYALLRPVLRYLDHLPPAHADALRAAFVLGPPSAADRFGIGAATLSLLAAAAEETAVLAVVDDLHWLDQPSLDAVLFAARRLGAERVGVLAARRPEGPEISALPVLTLGPVDQATAVALLHGRPAGPVEAGVVRALWHAAGGNPLALLEIADLLSGDQRSGRLPLPDALPVGSGIRAAFLTRITALPPGTQRALVVLALAGDPTAGELLTATRLLGLPDQAIAAAQDAGLVRALRGKVEFRHPLIRSAVLDRTPADVRREIHRTLAAATGDAARGTWHRAEAAVGPDEDLAAELDAFAAQASDRAAHATAVQAAVRAADLSADPESAAHRLLVAAEAALLAGSYGHAEVLVADALTRTDAPLLRADLARVAAHVQTWCGNVAQAHRALVDAGERIAAVDHARAALLFAEAVVPAVIGGDVPAAARAARRAGDLAGTVDAATAMVVTVSGAYVRVCLGEREHGLPLATLSERLDSPEFIRSGLCGLLGLPLIWAEDFDAARIFLTAAVDHARRNGAPGLLPVALTSYGELELRTGNWAAAQAAITESVELSEQTGQHNEHAHGLVTLVRLAAARGDDEEARSAASQAMRIVADRRLGGLEASIHAGLGLLELGSGRLDAAIERLETTRELLRRHGVRSPTVVPWRPDLVEAYARAGRPDDAAAELESLRAEGEHTGSRWARACVARGEVLLAGDDDLDRVVTQACAAHDGPPTPFERARTLVVVGERLRRARRPADARGPLADALATFDGLGASSWAARARAELDATGERRRAPGPAGTLADLTPQELQVALAVAKGVSNREAAAVLFLSPKTVEAHLGRVYRKLGIRSRTALVARVLGAGETAT